MRLAPRQQRSRLKSPWTGTSSRTSIPTSFSAFVQTRRRLEAGRIIVAGDIEAERGRGQIEGGEVVGREPGNHWQ